MPRAEWPADPQQLRREVHAMRDALLAARVPATAVRGVCFKGRASKAWRAPCDAVPALSNLDVHVWFQGRDAAAWVARFQDSSFSPAFVQGTEARFFAACPAPLHVPRPQLLILNHAMRWTP